MRNYKETRDGIDRRPTWREYQNRFKKPNPRRKGNRWPILLTVACVALTVCYLGWASLGSATAPATVVSAVRTPSDLTKISKKDVQLLLSTHKAEELLAKEVALPFNQQRFHIETSLDESLQNRLVQAMDRKNSRYIGVVVMEPETGRIVAMAGFNKITPEINPCLSSEFPAASIFKIVTAAAAVDQFGFQPETVLHFRGYKYSLYKNQVTDGGNRNATPITFEDSFAQSVNPVFGKLGSLRLGKPLLEQYGTAFGFNQPIEFELPISPSHLEIRDEPYNWAEIASGFNSETTVSPLHAAVMAATVLNEGRIVAPTLVDRITDEKGRELYRGEASYCGRAMTTEASATLFEMMQATVQSGTARKAFANLKQDKILSRLRIGGKTGTISNRERSARFDWFVGWAAEKNGGDKVAVASMVAHGDLIGTRAGAYARMAISHYFQNQFAQQLTRQTSATDAPTGG
jgi:cell division protein FtsI/penicillin-binding protein 2